MKSVSYGIKIILWHNVMADQIWAIYAKSKHLYREIHIGSAMVNIFG